MEEAVGGCTNIHLAYPALVYGFLQVMCANRETEGLPANDVAITADGTIVDAVFRYHDVLARLAGRDDVRNAMTKYEAVALTLVDPRPGAVGNTVEGFPPPGSPLELNKFFETLYKQYDQRFIYSAPALKTTTRRVEWDPESPAVQDKRITGYEPRIGVAE